MSVFITLRSLQWWNTALTWTFSIQLQSVSILAKKLRCIDQIIREAVEIELHPNKMNREDGFCLSRSWNLSLMTRKNKNGLPQRM
jgi:hypothetical protein